MRKETIEKLVAACRSAVDTLACFELSATNHVRAELRHAISCYKRELAEPEPLTVSDASYRAAAKSAGVDPDALLYEAGSKIFSNHSLPDPPMDREALGRAAHNAVAGSAGDWSSLAPGGRKLWRDAADAVLAAAGRGAGVDVAAVHELAREMRRDAERQVVIEPANMRDYSDRLESALAPRVTG